MSADLELSVMDEIAARKLTERIRITAHNYADARQKLQELVAEAKTGNAHLALGYASWTAYLAEVLGEEPMRLARGERQEMVQMLSAEGMSTRAIAPIVGADRKTVMQDVRQVVQNGPPERPVQGLDGKTYTRPEPTEPAEPPKQKRRPLTDQARDAGWELRRAVERLERIYSDDRYTRTQNEIDSLIEPHIEYALSVITTH